MAAIVPVAFTPPVTTLRTGTAQATTGQTDWISVPQWAKFAAVFFNLSANAGTTPISTVSFLSADPTVLTDTDTTTLATGAAITAASQHVYNIGPGVTGIADAGDNAAADGSMGINALLPTILGVKVLNDRTTGDETYTYVLSIQFRRD